MSKEKLLPISIFSLAISLIISTSIIANSIENNGRFVGEGISQGLFNYSNVINEENNNNLDSKDILSLDEASKYLGISQERLTQVIIKDDSIPCVQISGQFIFSKKALEEWVKTSKFKM
ncbi:helix-turn-helix domain-containing protein [Clostridium tertium]|uniref:helix-turn-helix domain-containing protein n=1 Tax=Clostridium tertium TaxID=1559 RepID=UPI0024B3AA4A|nr:helix-turn-helix domain-containing protein [Clostridium tertium]MDI9215799.1 helix-turn-helix domain-containing protein [Clostridium tertium]